MKVLLDSCAFVDLSTGADSLSQSAISAFQNIDNECYLSVASVWELGLKQSLGKLNFNIENAVKAAVVQGIKLLEIDLPITLAVNTLPYYHKDPFDRIIIASAKFNNMTIMTSDSIFKKYDLDIIRLRKDELN